MFRNLKKTMIIAEIGVNHNGNLSLALKLILKAKEAGADFVKFQSFQTDFLAKKNTPKVDYQLKNMISTDTHFEMLKKLELDFESQLKLFNFCKKVKIGFLSTPYDIFSAKFLKKIGIKFLKISSADLTDKILHLSVSRLDLPVLISTGMSKVSEIQKTLNIYKQNYFKKEIALLHCVSNYPCSDQSQNMGVIPSLSKKFDCVVGYSDHSKSILSSVCAVSLGAKIIEKHFTLDKNFLGPDHKSSLNPEEFKIFVKNIRNTEIILGNSLKKCQKEEMSMKNISRKSLYYSRDIKKNNRLKISDFISMRPGSGESPMNIGFFLKKKIKINVNKFSLVKKNHL